MQTQLKYHIMPLSSNKRSRVSSEPECKKGCNFGANKVFSVIRDMFRESCSFRCAKKIYIYVRQFPWDKSLSFTRKAVSWRFRKYRFGRRSWNSRYSREDPAAVRNLWRGKEASTRQISNTSPNAAKYPSRLNHPTQSNYATGHSVAWGSGHR